MLKKALMEAGLSPRESEVAVAVSRAKSNKEVANELFVTEKTVKFHLTNIYKKMQVKSRAQLIVWSSKHLAFEEKSPAQDLVLVASPIPAMANEMPVGINKVGNA